MEIENDDIYRCTELTKEGKEIDIVRIGDVLLARDSLGSKFYIVVEEEDFDENILNILEEE